MLTNLIPKGCVAVTHIKAPLPINAGRLCARARRAQFFFFIHILIKMYPKSSHLNQFQFHLNVNLFQKIFQLFGFPNQLKMNRYLFPNKNIFGRYLDLRGGEKEEGGGDLLGKLPRQVQRHAPITKFYSQKLSKTISSFL